MYSIPQYGFGIVAVRMIKRPDEFAGYSSNNSFLAGIEVYDQMTNMGEAEYVEQDVNGDEHSEASDSSTVSEQVDETVREDMIKLEESFEEHGMKFRLIDRIGEGIFSEIVLIRSLCSLQS